MNTEEAINRLKQQVKQNNNVIKEARKNGDINTMQLTADLDTGSIAIETVLKALENSVPKEKLKPILKDMRKNGSNYYGDKLENILNSIELY